MLAPDTIPIAFALPVSLVLIVIAVWPLFGEGDDE